MSQVIKAAKVRIIAALIVMLPLAAVLFLLGAVFRLGKGLAELVFYPFVNLEQAGWWLRFFAQYVIPLAMVVGVVVATYLLGVLLSNRIGKFLSDFLARQLSEMPLIGIVFKSVRQLAQQLLGAGDGTQERKLVWLRLPGIAIWQIGVLVREIDANGMCVVFLPMALNVTNGYALVLHRSQLRPCSGSFAEMMEFYCSGGFVLSDAVQRDLAALPGDDPDSSQLVYERRKPPLRGSC